MIAAWMLYSIIVSLLLFASGFPVEFICRALGRPTRFVWCAVLIAAIGLSAIALARMEVQSFAVPAAQGGRISVVHNAATVVQGNVPADAGPPVPSTTSRILGVVDVALRLPDRLTSLLTERMSARTDSVLGTTLGVTALLSLLWLAFAAVRVRRFVRRLPSHVLDGHPVFMSENVGPAVIGVLRPSIVVPGWLLSMSDSKRRVILSHERQHATALDPVVLAAALILLALEVWNVSLWAIVERLRLAIEVDCDQRVVRAHGAPRDYGELLLSVYERSSSAFPRQLAFLSRQSSLELRIRRVVMRAPRPTRVGTASGLLVSALLVAVACETSAPTRTRSDSPEIARRDSGAPAMALAATQPRCLAGAMASDPERWKSLARGRRPELFNEIRGRDVVIGVVVDENCVLQRDTVVRTSGGLQSRGPDPYLKAVFGDTTGFARPRGMALVYGKGGVLTVVWAVRPSADRNRLVSGTQCGFGLRGDESCSWQGPLIIRMVDSVRALIAVRRFNAPDQPVDRLFLVTLSRPMPDLHSQAMRHGVVATQGGTVYVEDFLATQPLLLFAPSSSTGLSERKRMPGVRVIRDLIGVAQYAGVKLTLEQVDRLQANPSCDGPRGSCYQVDGIKISFPA